MDSFSSVREDDQHSHLIGGSTHKASSLNLKASYDRFLLLFGCCVFPYLICVDRLLVFYGFVSSLSVSLQLAKEFCCDSERILRLKSLGGGNSP